MSIFTDGATKQANKVSDARYVDGFRIERQTRTFVCTQEYSVYGRWRGTFLGHTTAPERCLKRKQGTAASLGSLSMNRLPNWRDAHGFVKSSHRNGRRFALVKHKRVLQGDWLERVLQGDWLERVLQGRRLSCHMHQSVYTIDSKKKVE